MIVTPIEQKVEKICESIIVKDYLRKHNIVGENFYTCSMLSVFGTKYCKDQVVILPESDNSFMQFGKIEELLSYDNCAYLIYKKMSAVYCSKSDLYFLNDLEDSELIPIHQLACFRPLETYLVGESLREAVSLRNYVLA